MGKKSKKSNKTVDVQDPVAHEDTAEHDDTNFVKTKKIKKLLDNSEITDNNSADSINTMKKKRNHASAAIVNYTRIQAVDNELEDTSSSLEPKKKKKKKHHTTHGEESAIENTITKNASNDDDESNIVKKKKKNKANSLLKGESNHDIDHVDEEPVDNKTKSSKKNKKKSNLIIGDSVVEEKSIEKISVEEKPKVTKSQKKKKTGTAVLNAEESQVTEEDIDKFCDELDEEDNKQYEDWVKLIEASLPPPRKNT